MQSPICAVAGALFVALWAVQYAAAAGPGAPAPGPAFQPPQRKTSPEAPKVFEYTREAGPDQTFFVVGEALTEDVVLWGTSDSAEQGQEWKPKVQFCNGRYLAATIPQPAYDGVFVAWAKSDRGWSTPFLLNAPEPWWVGPARTRPPADGRSPSTGGTWQSDRTSTAATSASAATNRTTSGNSK